MYQLLANLSYHFRMSSKSNGIALIFAKTVKWGVGLQQPALTEHTLDKNIQAMPRAPKVQFEGLEQEKFCSAWLPKCDLVIVFTVLSPSAVLWGWHSRL